MFHKKQKEEIILPDGRKVKIGQDAVPHTEAKVSTRELINLLKDAAKKGIFPPPAELA